MQLLNPRELYTFEEFFDTDIEKVSLTDMAARIQDVLKDEFGITCNLDHASEIFAVSYTLLTLPTICSL